MTSLFSKILLLLILALACIGCAGPTDPPPKSIAPLDTARVQAALLNIKTDAELAGCPIKCRAENSLLVIEGTVNSEAAKKRAEDLAKKTEGIKSVANHLMVEPNTHQVPGEAAPPP